MALPTLSVTPGSGATINTLPNAPQATANSVAVALATDHAAVPISAAALPLPAGAATAANQATEVSTLASILAAIQATDTTIAVSSRSGYIWGAVSAAAVATTGSTGGYAPNDTITLPTGTGVNAPAVLTIVATQLAAIPTIVNAGSGGAAGAQTLTGTTGTGTKFTLAATIAGGVITSINSITTVGNYSVNPATLTAEPVTGGGLVGATVSVKMAPLTLSVATGGVYTAPVTNPVSQGSASGSGLGATFNLTAFAPLATLVAGTNTSRQYLAFRNDSQALGLGASLTGSAGFGTLGTTSFDPGGYGYEWGGSRVPSNALSLIGQAAFQQFTAWEG
ncbi:hypothetical protein Msil_3061 [Methylocella silvestris BL2]|uniref:Uncharacterized protein n=1 Tax=Methylocella silvestris (strain DSM 15510 / CIP 108128 / LMG 27833 / NCIMB 13906 / BL2) TaxID=395965 RepID=B8EKU3_METSB|nr:hypothetical protein [Methylocella silvestris]ACK51971.1 hypothetical protein Msil_3061 [Methylocella silvestris BL2]